MARSRNIKPGFFKNEVLAELSPEIRLLFIGLWTLADREGRLEDRPKRIRAELFAFDGFDVDSMLSELQANDFLTRYEDGGTRFIQIENFVKHQDPHYKEKASEIPPPPGRENQVIATGITRTQRARILERDGYTCLGCGAKERLCIDHVLPVSRGGDSSDENLQVLCLSCNTKKGNKLDGETKNTKRTQERLSSPTDEVDSTSPQRQPNASALGPLNPDSLIPDSGFLDSLSTDSLIPDSKTLAPTPAGDEPPPVKAEKPKKPAKEQAPTADAWGAYAHAYQMRYGEPPVRNAKVNGQLAQFVGRVGAQEAPDIARFYVGHQGMYYVRNMHPIDALLKDAEKLRTEWATGRKVTNTQAQQADRTATNHDAFAPLIEAARRAEEAI